MSGATRSVSRRCARRSPQSAARATSLRCRRTTSPPRRSPRSCSRRALFAPTSAAPGRSSTGSFTASPTPSVLPARCADLGADLGHRACVVRLIGMVGTTAIEHGSSRSGRWLRERRLRITLWIAAIEGLLYLFHVLHWWAAVALAVIAVGFWWFVGRTSRSDVGAARRLDLRRVAVARPLRADRPLAREGGRDRGDRPARDRRLIFLFTRASLDCRPPVGRSQAVRQRVLVPRSQVRILAPQPQ